MSGAASPNIKFSFWYTIGYDFDRGSDQDALGNMLVSYEKQGVPFWWTLVTEKRGLTLELKAHIPVYSSDWSK